MLRKTTLAFMGILAPVALGSAPTVAQEFPTETIRLIVPYPPGGSADLIGRMVADKLSELTGGTVIVENRGGASGAIGSETVAQAEPDGHTLLIGIGDTHAINPAVNENLPYDPVEDFEPVSLLAVQPLALAVGPSVEAETLQEFIEQAKAEPESVFYATNGIGGMQHLSFELLSSLAGIEAVHTPFPGSGPAMAEVVGGHVDAIFISLQGGAANFEAGTMRPLAISATERVAAEPSIPTFAESGYEDFQVYQWYGLFAPAGTPEDVLDILNKHSAAAIQSPEIADKLGAAGTQAIGSMRDEFAAFLNEQIALWGKVAKENGITVQ